MNFTLVIPFSFVLLSTIWEFILDIDIVESYDKSNPLNVFYKTLSVFVKSYIFFQETQFNLLYFFLSLQIWLVIISHN